MIDRRVFAIVDCAISADKSSRKMLVLREILPSGTPQGRKGVRFVLWEGAEIVIGRCANAGQSHIIMAVETVSRKHATIVVSRGEKGLKVALCDETSKFGTFVNGKKISGTAELKAGDQLKFATFAKEWELVEEQMNVAASSVSSAEKAEVKRILRQIGGELVDDVSGCRYLLMTTITVTSKALRALIDPKIDIVTPTFFIALQSAIVCDGLVKQQLPKAEDFQPPIGEKSLLDANLTFSPNPHREKLFAGKKFLFTAQKQLDRLAEVVKMVHGESILLTNSNRKELSSPDSILVQPPASFSQNFDEILADYKRTGRHPIRDTEISLAIVDGSTEKYCNPKDIESQSVEATECPIADAISSALISLDSMEELPPAPLFNPDCWVPETQMPLEQMEISNSLDDSITEVPDSQPMEDISESPVPVEVPNEKKKVTKDADVVKSGWQTKAELQSITTDESAQAKTKVVFTDFMMRRQPFVLPLRSTSNRGGPNFKRFKKATGQLNRGDAKIIGGKDLMPHIAYKKVDHVIDDLCA